MRFAKELNQALKILLVFAVTTFNFRLIEKLSLVIFTGINRDGLKNLIEVSLIWFITMLLIIIGLCIYMKKIDGKLNFAFMHNPLIRLTSGFLITFGGIFNLSINIPVAIANFITIHQFASRLETTFGTSRESVLISNIIPSLINLIQVLLGLYLIIHKKGVLDEKET